ncbi:MAG TPA: hypothetical protein VMU45_09900 [Candidatus Eisenbacteria bacterium]|nr:hypothetical protein [Candidatus Eisenbacteria bacterium]
MSIGSWFKNFFHHINPHNLAGALAAAKTALEGLNNVEHWPWFSQFETASTTAINALNTWQPGQPTTEITQALNAAVGILNSVEGLSAKDKSTVSVFVSAAEAALAFLG